MSTTRECPSCKAKLDPAYVFCPECGSPVPRVEKAEPAAAVDEGAAEAARHHKTGVKGPREPAWAGRAAEVGDASTLEAGRRPEARPAPPEPAARDARPKPDSGSRPRPGMRFRVVRLARGGGHSAEQDLPEGGLSVGRVGTDIVFADDVAVSPRHIEMVPVGNHVEVHDLGSTNGVYVRIRAEHRLVEGDVFICGDSVFRVSLAPSRFDPTEYRLFAAPQEKPVLATVTHILADGADGEVWPVRTLPFLFGREEGDVRCGADRFMSRKHAVIQSGPQGLMLADMKSRNGTYVLRRGDLSLVDGDVIMVGRQLLRIEALAQ